MTNAIETIVLMILDMFLNGGKVLPQDVINAVNAVGRVITKAQAEFLIKLGEEAYAYLARLPPPEDLNEPPPGGPKVPETGAPPETAP